MILVSQKWTGRFGIYLSSCTKYDKNDIILYESAPRIIRPLTFGGLAQLARATALHAVGHRFDSDNLHKMFIILKFVLYNFYIINISSLKFSLTK